jgi:murein DD-endopeptidase MepM/ murein hydrolase activator NlpD
VSSAVILVACLSLGAGTALGARAIGSRGASTAGPEPVPSALCPANTLFDGAACVHLPDDDEGTAEPALEAMNAHYDRGGRWIVYDQIPRRPDRPAEYDAYRYPVPCEGCVVSGYDLDRPDAHQRRGRRLKQVGHGAIDLLDRRGTPIMLVALEHQHGDAEVLYVGPLFGTTVVTRHTLREAGELHDYVLLFGHLDAPAPGLVAGAHLKEGDLVGYVGDSGSPSLVHLHLEARRVRDGVDAARVAPGSLLEGSNTVVCDPRNVLPLK